MKPLIFAAALACSATLLAHDNPLSAEARINFSTIKDYVIRASEKMPAEDYAFKPTPDIRSFGQLIGHIADDQYTFCGVVKNEKRPTDFEKNPPPKAEIVAALKAAFAYSESAYGLLTDSWANEQIRFLGRERPKLNILTFNTEHAWEHYGNIVVYMRLKGLVPPSSEKKQ
jgi:uncharacterized damage-inducible protein DinB